MTAYYAAFAARFGMTSKVFQGNSATPRGLTAQYRNAVCLVMDSTHIYERMDESTAGRKFLLTDTPHPKREKGFPLDCLSVDSASGRYYYDLADHATDEIASADSRMSQAYARFFSEALEAFHRETGK